MSSTPDYPAAWETHAVLRDGSTAEIRPIQPTDRDALVRFHGQQSRESIYFRYFRYRPVLSEAELDHFTLVDYRDRMAFVALQGGELIAVARYELVDSERRQPSTPDGRPRAEVAFFVHDDHQGKGLGTLMLEYLAAAARHRGLAGFTATVLSENYRMLGVFRSAGFEVSTRFADGAIEVDLGIDVTSETSSAIADRHRLATARSVARIMEARTVAVIGASRQPGSVGHELVRHLLDGAEAGSGGTGDRADDPITVLAVNPVATEILGLTCHPTIAEAAQSVAVDLAVIAVRAELVPDIVGQCVDAGVAGLLIISVGFSDLDDAGAAREREIVELARDSGVRLIGPAAFGLINTTGPRLQAVYHPVTAAPGRVGVGSQSGPLGAAVLDRLSRRHVGVSSFVGMGSRADVSVNDLLDYWSLDPSTDAVVLYVENFGNLRNFSTVARRTCLTKPIVTVRPSSPDQVELLRQAGVILVDEVSQLAEQVELVVTQPAARGDRVAVVSNSASVARLCTGACRRYGLQPVVPDSVPDAVAGAGRDGSVLIGDLDSVALRPSGDPADYERVVVATAVSNEVDLLVLALTPNAYFDRDELAGLLSRVNRAIDKPVVAVGLVPSEVVPVDGLPIHAFPESAARALGRHARYGHWRAAHAPDSGERAGRSAGQPEGRSVAADPLAQVIDRLLAGGNEAVVGLANPDLPVLLDELGVPLAAWGAADGVDEALILADEIGYPVVLKAANLATRSLGEWGGTAIDLHDRDDLEAAHGRMSDTLGVAMRTSVVQRMVASVGAIRLELLQDPAFGAMISIGTGGSAQAETVPVARRFLPLDRDEALSLVRSMAHLEELAGVDEATEAAVADLVEVLVRAAGATDHLARVTLNPILLSADRAVPTDVEIVLRRTADDPLRGVRHL